MFAVDVKNMVAFVSLVHTDVCPFRLNILKLEDVSLSQLWISPDDPKPDKSCTAAGTPNEPGVPGVFGA